MRDAILFAKGNQTNISNGVFLSNLNHFGFREFGHTLLLSALNAFRTSARTVAFSNGSSAARYGISGIFPYGPITKVGWSNANRIVAGVENKIPRFVSGVNQERKPVSPHLSCVGMAKNSVAIMVRSWNPDPAITDFGNMRRNRAVLVDFRPEPGNIFFSELDLAA